MSKTAETEMAVVTKRDYDLLIGALKQIKFGRFIGAEAAVMNDHWHEYAAQLQQIANDALVNILEGGP